MLWCNVPILIASLLETTCNFQTEPYKQSLVNIIYNLTNNDGSSFEGRLEKDRYLYFFI